MLLSHMLSMGGGQFYVEKFEVSSVQWEISRGTNFILLIFLFKEIKSEIIAKNHNMLNITLCYFAVMSLSFSLEKCFCMSSSTWYHVNPIYFNWETKQYLARMKFILLHLRILEREVTFLYGCRLPFENLRP